MCMICMGEVKEGARPNNCNHEFCMECLKQWSIQTNLCPLCRKEFRAILFVKNGRKASSVAKK